MKNVSLSLIGYEEVSKHWEIERLFVDLGKVKAKFMKTAKSLSDNEKQYLCLLLLRHNPQEIASKFKVKPETVRKALSDNLYRYLNALLEQKIEERKVKERKIKEWQDVAPVLEDEGYKQQKQLPNNILPASSLEDLIPIGWIWLGAVNSTSPSPPVGAFLIPLGEMRPVTIFPMEVPEINSMVSVIQFVNVRTDRPQAESNYQLFPKVGTALSIGTRLIILEVDCYLDLTTSHANARVWAKVGIWNPPIIR
jgi:DNA-binding CsgD family transcriptional regulator